MTTPGPAAGDADRLLLQAHVDGDGDAFGELVRRHQDRLWAVAVRTLDDPQEAADALQDALVSAFRHAASFRGDAAVGTWLHRIVVNACLDRMRRRRSRPTVPLDSRREPVAPWDAFAAAEARADLRAALATLPEGQRTALVLVEMEGLPVAEVAQILGVAEGTVKSRCARARIALGVALRGNQEGADAVQARDAGAPVGPAQPAREGGGHR